MISISRFCLVVMWLELQPGFVMWNRLLICDHTCAFCLTVFVDSCFFTMYMHCLIDLMVLFYVHEFVFPCIHMMTISLQKHKVNQMHGLMGSFWSCI